MKRVMQILTMLIFVSPSLCTLLFGVPLEAEAGADLNTRTGEMIASDIWLMDEFGRRSFLRNRLGKPTILTLNYYECKSICTPMLSDLADALDKMALEPGKDYQVWTVSIDENETAELARRKKVSILTGMRHSIPDDSWSFFTGSKADIERLAASAGYSYSRQGDGFMHPGALIILSPEGKIIRYIYGRKYLPLDLEMSVMEASQGRSGQTIRQTLLTCFRYDSKGKAYIFNVTRFTGAGVILSLAILWVTLGMHKRSRGGK